MEMRNLLGDEGRAALAAWSTVSTLFAFDFDGTLAPIVTMPDRARMSAPIHAALDALARSAPVAVISGRALEDLDARLPDSVRWRLGNHGNEGLPGREAALDTARLHCRAWAQTLASRVPPGVVIENKGASLSLHYRLAPDRAAAHAAVLARARALEPAARLMEGKCVLNVLPQGALSKREGLMALLAQSGCTHAVFVGDDVTDEDVFVDAPASWLTVRVGVDRDSAARWFVSAQIDVLRLLRALHEQGAHRAI
jgi:trehalose 6-phosphate phosphatase